MKGLALMESHRRLRTLKTGSVMLPSPIFRKMSCHDGFESGWVSEAELKTASPPVPWEELLGTEIKMKKSGTKKTMEFIWNYL